MKYEIKLYETPSGRVPVLDYLANLSKESKTRDVSQIIKCEELLKEYGLEVNFFFHDTIKKINNDIYELRPGKHRIFFFYFTGNEFILLHAFRKRSQKTPRREINQAIREMKDHKRRNSNE